MQCVEEAPRNAADGSAEKDVICQLAIMQRTFRFHIIDPGQLKVNKLENDEREIVHLLRSPGRGSVSLTAVSLIALMEPVLLGSTCHSPVQRNAKWNALHGVPERITALCPSIMISPDKYHFRSKFESPACSRSYLENSINSLLQKILQNASRFINRICI